MRSRTIAALIYVVYAFSSQEPSPLNVTHASWAGGSAANISTERASTLATNVSLNGSAAELLVSHGSRGSAKRRHTPVCDAAPLARPIDENFQFGSLNDVVGRDGVLVISLLRVPFRFEHSSVLLKQAGIWPTEFPAADSLCLEKAEMDETCPLHGDWKRISQSCNGKSGMGCKHDVERAIAESHRRALVAAQERDSDWTAILEEDVVPVRPERWNEAFKNAWANVPKGIKMVRLSWCTFPGDHPGQVMGSDVFMDSGEFFLSNWTGYSPEEPDGNPRSDAPPDREYNSGGCTGGYIVHRSIIPELLNLFPCCCALDCCLQYDFFGKPVPIPGGEDGEELELGLQVMLSMDAWGSTEYAMNFTYWGLFQSGVMVQDSRENPSTREELGLEKMFTYSPSEDAWHLSPEGFTWGPGDKDVPPGELNDETANDGTAKDKEFKAGDTTKDDDTAKDQEFKDQGVDGKAGKARNLDRDIDMMYKDDDARSLDDAIMTPH